VIITFTFYYLLKNLIKKTPIRKMKEPIYTVLLFVILCKNYFCLIPGLQKSDTYPYLKIDESFLSSTLWFFNSRFNMHPFHVLIHCKFKINFDIAISAKSSFSSFWTTILYVFIFCNVFYLNYWAYLRVFVHHDNIWRIL
jgi:hypothetical protein